MYGADYNNAYGSTYSTYEEQRQPKYISPQPSTPIVKLQQMAPPQVQQPPPQVQRTVTANPQKRELVKILTYVMIIVFALALYSVFEMIIKELVNGNDLGYKQELGIRVIYAFIVVIILWNIRNFMS